MTQGKGHECRFCLIVAPQSEARKVHADDLFTAFLDHRPLFPGHVLVIPNTHVETLTDLPSDLVGPLFQFVQRVAEAVQHSTQSEGTFVGVNNKVSQSVPHLHVHVVPRNRRDGLRGFFWPRHAYEDDAHADRVQAAIAEELSKS